jgi:hypothetical protein
VNLAVLQDLERLVGISQMLEHAIARLAESVPLVEVASVALLDPRVRRRGDVLRESIVAAVRREVGVELASTPCRFVGVLRPLFGAADP